MFLTLNVFYLFLKKKCILLYFILYLTLQVRVIHILVGNKIIEDLSWQYHKLLKTFKL